MKMQATERGIERQLLAITICCFPTQSIPHCQHFLATVAAEDDNKQWETWIDLRLNCKFSVLSLLSWHDSLAVIILGEKPREIWFKLIIQTKEGEIQPVVLSIDIAVHYLFGWKYLLSPEHTNVFRDPNQPALHNSFWQHWFHCDGCT